MCQQIDEYLANPRTQESQEIYLELALELGQIGRQLKLLRDQLCHRCEMLNVEEKTTILPENAPFKEKKAEGK